MNGAVLTHPQITCITRDIGNGIAKETPSFKGRVNQMHLGQWGTHVSNVNDFKPLFFKYSVYRIWLYSWVMVLAVQSIQRASYTSFLFCTTDTFVRLPCKILYDRKSAL